MTLTWITALPLRFIMKRLSESFDKRTPLGRGAPFIQRSGWEQQLLLKPTKHVFWLTLAEILQDHDQANTPRTVYTQLVDPHSSPFVASCATPSPTGASAHIGIVSSGTHVQYAMDHTHNPCAVKKMTSTNVRDTTQQPNQVQVKAKLPEPPIPSKVRNIPTPVQTEALTKLLSGYHDREFLVKGFAYGFKLGVQNLSHSLFSKNHKSVHENPSIVSNKLKEESSLGRIAGPFVSPPFTPFVTSPLGLVPKKEQNSYILIHDLSFPKELSVNAHIPRDATTVHYETLDHLLHLVKHTGRGTLKAKADIESAFRIIPIHPSQHYLLGFTWEGQFYYDRCLPMGCSTSCTIFERFSSAIQWVLTHKMGVKCMSHILDDFMFLGSRSDNQSL